MTREDSCNPNDLLLDWPVRLNPASNPMYANFPKCIDTGKLVGLTGNPAVTTDHGGKAGHNGTDTGGPSWRPINSGALEVRAIAGGYLDLVRDGLFDNSPQRSSRDMEGRGARKASITDAGQGGFE